MKGQGTSTSSPAISEGQKENLTPQDQENSSIISKKTPTPRKSLIPLFKDKSTPTRQALTPIQKSGTPKESEMVGRTKGLSGNRTGGNIKNKNVDTPRPTTAPSKPKRTVINKVGQGLTPKGKNVDKNIQTLNPDIELITGDEPPLSYWKELAETRRQALEETVQENESLHKRVEELEKENKILEEIVEEAKALGELINSISEDENPDESGIGRDSEDTSCVLDSSSS